MKSFIIQLAGLALTVYYLLPSLVPGISVTNGRAAIIAAILFAFINIAVRPIIGIITLPLNILTFGILGIIINVLLFWFVASIVVGFTVANLTAAFWGAIVMTVANWILHRIS